MGEFLPFVSGPLPGSVLPATYDPWLVALSYVFFYWYRVYIEDPKYSEAGEPPPAPAAAGD